MEKLIRGSRLKSLMQKSGEEKRNRRGEDLLRQDVPGVCKVGVRRKDRQTLIKDMKESEIYTQFFFSFIFFF